MVTLNEMKSQLTGVGIITSDDLLELCCEFCLRNDIDEADFVDSWVAYAFTELSANTNITYEALQIFERKKFESKSFGTPKQAKSIKNTSKTTPFKDSTPKRKKLLQYHAKSPNDGLTFSPTSYSPSVNKEQRESNIPSGKILLYHSSFTDNWKADDSYKPEIKSFHGIENNNWKYMYDVLYDIWNLNEDFCEELAEKILNSNNLTEPLHFSMASGENAVFIGRVLAEESRINSQMVEIQGIGSSCLEKVDVDMSQVPAYSLFPGQVVVFEGFRDGKKLIATKLYISGKGPASEPPKIKETLQFVVAVGPLVGPDQQNSEALNMIIKYLVEHKPNFCFFVGPLIDATNHQSNITDFAESFDSYHQRVLSQITNSLIGVPTKCFFISSHKDVVGLPIYPTLPLTYTSELQNGMTSLPDPSLVNIDGLTLGITSVDSIFHLSKKEISNCRNNRLARLAGHLINQQTFYPLFPSDLDLGIDFKLWHKYTRIPVVPHILILPSDLHFFVKNIDGCLIINPERTVKGLTRGSFAHVEVKCQTEAAWSVDSDISVKIIKV